LIFQTQLYLSSFGKTLSVTAFSMSCEFSFGRQFVS